MKREIKIETLKTYIKSFNEEKLNFLLEIIEYYIHNKRR